MTATIGRVTAIALTLAGSLALVRAQNQPATPTFRSTIQYVEVEARVTDREGNAMRGLQQQDFRLLEDGDEQTVETFTAVDLPFETNVVAPASAKLPLIVPDVAINTDQATLRGRLYVLLLDDRQISAANGLTTIRIATDFIERNVGLYDLVAIVTTTGRTDMSQSFTANKQILLTTIERFAGNKLVPAVLEVIKIDENLRRIEEFNAARMSLEGLTSVCNWLGAITGMTKSLVLISEGVDYDYETDLVKDPYATEVLSLQRSAIAAATRANVTVYPVDPRGLGSDESIQAQNNVAKELRQAIDRSHSGLRDIAVSTGGVEALNTNQFEAAFDRIVRQGSTYYLLGYHPKNPRREGKFRTIKLTVNRPGAQVSARRGYGESDRTATAPKRAPLLGGPATMSPAVREALNSPLPLHEMALSIAAVAYRGTGQASSLAVIVESPSLTLTEKDGKFTGGIELVTAAIDDRNTIVSGQSNRVTFTPAAETAARIRQRGFRTLSRLNDLAPGRYELRVATTDLETGRRGSVWYAFDVPDFSKGKLSMSGVIVSSLAESATFTGNPDRVLNELATLTPTTVRQFHDGDELTIVAEVYDNDLSAPHRVELSMSVTGADGKDIFRKNESASYAALTSNRGAYRILTTVPLAGVAPGNYTIRLQAQQQVDKPDPPVVRTVPITIVK